MTAPTPPTTATTHPALITTYDEHNHPVPDPYYFHNYNYFYNHNQNNSNNNNHAHTNLTQTQTQEPETYDDTSDSDSDSDSEDTSSETSDSLDEDDITWEFPFPFLQGLPCCSPTDSVACLASPKGPPPPDFAVRIRPEQLRLRHRRVQSLSGLSTSGGFGGGMGIGRVVDMGVGMGGFKVGSGVGVVERDGEGGKGVMVRSMSNPGWNLGG